MIRLEKNFAGRRPLAALLALLSLLHGFLYGSETAMPDANGLTHWLYTPTEKPVAGRTYWLVVGVHGAGGTETAAASRLGRHTSMT